ncbi:ribbon-helix-helix protein, CopG family, partial [Haloferax volcanii]
MGNKNKTISFRVNEDAFETLREIAEERDISLSAVFRDYVDTLVAHDGQVQVVPKHELEKLREGEDESFPPTVEVPKSFIREHERL